MRRNWIRKILTLTASAVTLFVLATASPPSAEARIRPPSVPEIDPGALASTIALVVGGAAVLTGRRRR